MRLASIVLEERLASAVAADRRLLPLPAAEPGFGSIREIAGGGGSALGRIRRWIDEQPDRAWRALDGVMLGPAVPDPGAIYTVGLNYRAPDGNSRAPGGPVDEADGDAPGRPLIYGKAATSVTGHGAVVTWDRTLTANVDAECELGVVIGEATPPNGVGPADAMGHVFGYTCVDDISSRDPWLDGDQWLLGKSMPGFCPVGPWVVTADEIDPLDLRLGCRVNGIAIQEDSTARMRFGVAEVISFLSRHVVLRPGDLIATGTPPRLAGPLGPERRLAPGDTVTCWIEHIGELTNTIA
jgi:2-keto-4-pentenoate hydratase/2-oxohepta-3-ene-1,7-dioic acid hydratase in catechol pathway